MQTDSPGSLHDRFENFGAAPTGQLWDSISKSLDEQSKKKRGAFWWWFAGIAASLVLLFGIYKLGYQAGKKDAVLTNALNPTSEETKINDPGSGHNTFILDAETQHESEELAEVENNAHPEPATNLSVGRHEKENTNGINQDEPLGQNSPAESAGNKKIVARDVMLNEVEITTLREDPVDGANPVVSEIVSPYICECPLPPESIQVWEVGFGVGTSRGIYASNQKAELNITGFTADNLSQENTIQGSGLTSLTNLSESSVSFFRPLSLDFTVGRKLTNRFTLQSGLSFNYLKSTNYYNSADGMHVRAHFISVAVPVMAEFDYVKRMRLECSAGLGFVNEFPVYSWSTTGYTSGALASSTSKSFVSGYMASVLFNTGISYRLNENVQIGLYPNIRYYLKQSLNAAYPVLERNLWTGVSAGVRLGL